VRLLIFPLGLMLFSSLLVALLGDRLALPEDFAEVVEWLRGYGNVAWLVGVGVIMADALLPVPSTPAMLAMGIIYGPIVGGLICGTASLLAGMTGFFGTRILGDRVATKLVGEQDLARTRGFYDRWGLLAVVFGRAVGGPAEWIVILAGLSTLPVWRVAAAVAVGGYVSGFVMATLGAYSVDEPALALGVTLLILLALAGIARRAVRAPAVAAGSTE